MLDLNQLIAKQNEGNQLLSGLTEDEAAILQNYGYLCMQGIIDETARRNDSVDNLILNTYRNGICLGLGLEIANGCIQERSKP